MIGKEVRLKQLFKHSAKLFVLPLDHGITIGPVDGLKNIPMLINSVKDYIDAFVVHKGLVTQVPDITGKGGCNLMVHLSASTVMAPDPNRKELVTSVEHAIRLGATAVSVHVNMGSAYEAEMLKDLGQIAETCEMWGMPLLAMMYVRDGNRANEYDPEKIKHAARAAEELGADIVKVNYTGSFDTFKDVTGSVKIPVIIAGGPKMSSDYELLKMLYDSVKAGAAGVAFGRNVFQHQNPAPLSLAIRKILDDEGLSDEQLQEIADAYALQDSTEEI